MTVQLSPEQQRWLEAQVAAGHFTSLEEAVAIAFADLMTMTEDDLAWAKPLVDEAASELDRGERIPAADVFRTIRKKFDL